MTLQDTPLRRRCVMVAATVLSLTLAAACNGEAQRAQTTSQAVDSPPSAGPQPTGGVEGAAANTQEADPGSGTDGDQGSGTDLERAERPTPQEATLDIEVRHPAGTVIRLDRVAFEDNDILLDVEIINSARWSVRLHGDGHPWNRLRLVDEAGREYHFVETDEGPLTLASGESITGTLAFRGPLTGRPERVHLVTNTASSDAGRDFDIDKQVVGEKLPQRYVIPIELTWE